MLGFSAQGRYIETLHAYFQSSRLVGAVARPPRRRWNVPFPTSVVPCTVRGAEVVVCARFFNCARESDAESWITLQLMRGARWR